MTVKETYHADCLRIKQLEQQLARYKEMIKKLLEQLDIEEIYQDWSDVIKPIKEEFESEQNER